MEDENSSSEAKQPKRPRAKPRAGGTGRGTRGAEREGENTLPGRRGRRKKEQPAGGLGRGLKENVRMEVDQPKQTRKRRGKAAASEGWL